MSFEHLQATLASYAANRRASGIMGTQAIGLAPDEITMLARHYATAATPSSAPSRTADPALAARGRKIALGLGSGKLPACAACHGPAAATRNPYYPPLAGQPESYLQRQLLLFQGGERGGTRFAPVMYKIAPMLSEEDIKAVAAYYNALPREGTSAS